MTLAVLVFLSYSIIAVNTAAIAQKHYLRAGGSCVMFMLVGFFVTKHIVEAKTTYELVLYIIGWTAGDMTGIFITNYFDRKAKKSGD
jgi:hypothetical protein